VSVTSSQDILTRPVAPTELRFAYGADANHFGDLRLPSTASPGPYPVVIVLHGGFWRARYNLEHIGHLCSALSAQGMATWSLEYRRVGQAGGGWPGTLQDVALGAAHLGSLAQRYPLDLARVVAIGHSAGGHLALWLAAHQQRAVVEVDIARLPFAFTGIVSLAGVADLRLAARLGLGSGAVEALLGGSAERYPERFAAASPRERLPLGVPQRLVHGADDEPVPIEVARSYCAAAAAAGDDVTLTALPRTGHFEVIDPLSHAWPPVLAAVTAALQT
jgi:acetyl esterase/lipase